jgi:hypothetical protein
MDPEVDQKVMHLRARLAAVRCYYQCEAQIPEAVRLFEKVWNSQLQPGDAGHVKDPYHHIAYQAEKLERDFTLQDLPRSGRPVTMPDDVVWWCADIIAKGYLRPMDHAGFGGAGGRLEYVEFKDFGTLGEAIACSAELHAIMQEYGVTKQHLLCRLHEVDARLVHGPLPFKFLLSDELMAERAAYARTMLDWLRVEPDLLSHITWFDECRIWVDRHAFKQLKVWHRRGSYDGAPPLPHPLWDGKGAVKTDILLGVNAKVGLVWVEFLTGSTDIQELGRHNEGMRHNMRYRDAMLQGEYTVSYQKIIQPVLSSFFWRAPGSWVASHST